MFAGRTALITGAAGGIGRCLTRRLCEKNAIVTAVDISADSLTDLQKELAKDGHSLSIEVADVTQASSLASARDNLLVRHKRLDFWFNNAGVARNGTFMKMQAADFDRVMDINFKGVVNGTRLALAAMEDQGGGHDYQHSLGGGSCAGTVYERLCGIKIRSGRIYPVPSG